MKKILTFFLTACMIFTFSFTGVFADTPDWAGRAESDATKAIDYKAYPICCADDLNKVKNSFIDEVKNCDKLDEADYYTHYATFLNNLKNVQTTNQQKAALDKIKTNILSKIANEKAALKIEFNTDNSPTFDTDFDTYINYNIAIINSKSIVDGHIAGEIAVDLTDATKAINNQYTKIIDINNFKTVVGQLSNVDKLIQYAENYANIMKLQKDKDNNAKYNAASVDSYLAKTKNQIYALSILNVADVEAAMNECPVATKDAETALVKAKADAITAITTGDYDLKKWGSEVAGIQADYITKINGAKTIDQVNAYVAAAKAAIDKTKPVDKDKIIADLEKKIADLEKENAELKAKADADAAIKTIIGEAVMSVKTKKVNNGIKVTVSGIDLGTDEYIVKYKFYRSIKNGNYTIMKTKDSTIYTNTFVKKNIKYYYKAIAVVYDTNGNEIGRTALADCKAGVRRG